MRVKNPQDPKTNGNPSLRVLIVDDHAVVRAGLRSLLSRMPGIEVCGEAADGPDAVEKARRLQPDVITMDVGLPGMSGLDATREIRRFLPDAQILVVTLHDSPELIAQALSAGASGYVLKSDVSTDLVEGLERLQCGQPFPNQTVLAGSEKGANIDEILQRNAAFQRALSQSAQRLEQLLGTQLAITSNMTEGLYTVDSDGLVTSINPAAEATLGWSKEELLGKKMHDVTHHRHPDGTPFPAADCPGLQVLQTGIVLREYEDVFIRKDGSYVPVVFSASPLKTNGRITGVVVCFRDDTEQRRSREELYKTKQELEIANDQFRLVTSKMGAAVTRCSRDFRYLWANERYAEWIERPLHEIIGARLADILGTTAFELLRPRFEQVLTGTPLSHQRETEFRGIGRRWTASTYTPTFDSSGTPDGWVAVVQDITDHKRVEATLRDSERKLMAIADAFGDLSRLDDRLVRITNVKQAYKLILQGAMRLMRAGKGAMHLLDPVSGALKMVAQHGFEQPFLRFFETVGDNHASACGAAMQQGERVIVEDVTQSPIFAGQASLQVLLDAGVRAVQSTPLVSSSGKHLGMISTHFDIPHQPPERELRFMELWARHAADYLERMQAEEHLTRHRAELEQEIEERTKELRDVNRELSTFSVRLMQAQDEERRRVGRELHDAAGQTIAAMNMLGAQIAREVSEASPRAAEGLEQLRALSTQLGQEIRTTSYLLYPPLLDEIGLRGALGWLVEGFTARGGIEAHLQIPRDLARLPRDMEMAIFRLVQEALTNVHRYSNGSRCTVQVECPGTNVSVSVHDNGNGMTPERLDQVRLGKTGVGIRGIRERVRQFQGTFDIGSDASGTTITATFPLGVTGRQPSRGAAAGSRLRKPLAN